jgi:hypothetical protein
LFEEGSDGEDQGRSPRDEMARSLQARGRYEV